MSFDACHVALVECLLCLLSFFLWAAMLIPAYSAALCDWPNMSMSAIDAGV